MHLNVLSVVLKNLLLLLFCTIWQWCEELHLHEDLWSLGLNCNSVSCVQGWKGKSSQEKDGVCKPSVSWISGPKVSWPRTLSLGALPGALQLTQSGMMMWECVSSQKSYDISSWDWYYQAMGSCRRVLLVSWRAPKSLMAIAEPSFPPMLSSGSKRWVLFLLGYSLLSVSPNCGSLLSLCLWA